MFGNRADGRRIKAIDPFMKIIPYIMKTRNDSENFFEEKWYLEDAIEYIKGVKQEKNVNISYMVIVVAALGRMLNERPWTNRFVRNAKIYARNKVEISFSIKKQLTDEAKETTAKIELLPQDTIFDVERKMTAIIEKNKEETKNSTDKLAKFIMSFPGAIIKFIVGVLTWLDNHELMPKKVIEASPFHTSAFITNVGTLGINSIYHHIYNFGTTSMFLAIGSKQEEMHEEGNRKYISLKMVTDERICDGKYYANSFQLLEKYMNNPKLLEIPLNEKVYDIK